MIETIEKILFKTMNCVSVIVHSVGVKLNYDYYLNSIGEAKC